MARHENGERLIIEIDRMISFVKDSVEDGFIEEIDPSFAQEVKGDICDRDYEIVTVKRRRFVPTEIGLEFLRFKLL